METKHRKTPWLVPLAAASLSSCAIASPPQTLNPQRSTINVDGAMSRQPDGGSSWIAPNAIHGTSLLYVSDVGRFDVRIYSIPSLKLVGTLKGLEQPQGECSDAQGNVWITTTQGGTIVEYAHGGTSPIKKLVDPTGYPVGCAIDPGSGDLAVTNLYDFSGPASVLVYKRANGIPASYSNPSQYLCFLAGYTGSGNLYVSGQTSASAYVLSVLPKGRQVMSTVSIKGGTLYFPGTVAWLGTSLILGDQKCGGHKSSCFYRTKVAGTTATITGVTRLTQTCDVAQAVVQATRLLGGNDAHCNGGKSTVDLWPYPTGGNPSLRVGGIETPVGAALSISQAQ